MSTLKNKTVITKKVHRCFSCERDFPEKTKMNYWAGIFEGDFCDSYACMTCVEIMGMDKGEHCFPEGYVSESLSKGETPEQFLEQLKNNQP